MGNYMNLADDLKAVAARHLPSIVEALDGYGRVQATVEHALAAARGGWAADGDVATIEAEKKQTVREIRDAGFAARDALVADLNNTIDDAFTVDVADVAALAPVAGVKMPDAEVMRVARANLDNYAALMVLSSMTGDAAAAIKRALDGVTDAAASVGRRVSDLVADGLLQQTEYGEGHLARLVDRVIDSVGDALNNLNAAVAPDAGSVSLVEFMAPKR